MTQLQALAVTILFILLFTWKFLIIWVFGLWEDFNLWRDLKEQGGMKCSFWRYWRDEC